MLLSIFQIITIILLLLIIGILIYYICSKHIIDNKINTNLLKILNNNTNIEQFKTIRELDDKMTFDDMMKVENTVCEWILMLKLGYSKDGNNCTKTDNIYSCKYSKYLHENILYKIKN